MKLLKTRQLDTEGQPDGYVPVIRGGEFIIGPADAVGGGGMTPYSTFTVERDAGNPTLVDGTLQAMPENIIKVGTTYWLLYSASDTSTFTRLHLASSDSPDGPWTPYGSNPILTVGSQAWEGTAVHTNAGCIIEDGGTFYLFYAVNTTGAVTPGIGVATATSITGPYTKYASNPVLSPGASGAWDSLRVQEPDVAIMDDGTWVMAYMGEQSGFTQGTTEKIGIATAPGPLGPWTKDADNPVIGFGASGAWDAAVAADPSIWQDPSGYWWMLYSGTASGPGPAGAALGLAYALDPTGIWTRYGKILSPSGTSGAFDQSGVFRGAVYVENGTYHLPYVGVPASGTRKGGNASWTLPSSSDLHDHEAATDPHPQYLTQSEGDARYVRTVNGTAPDGTGNVTVSGGSTSSSGELLMQDGVTAPPAPLENEARSDWLYQG